MIFLCAIVSVLVAVDAWANREQVYEGIEVGTVSVGGTSRDAAKKILSKRASSELEQIQRLS